MLSIHSLFHKLKQRKFFNTIKESKENYICNINKYKTRTETNTNVSISRLELTFAYLGPMLDQQVKLQMQLSDSASRSI
jgi:hypothetical protein